MHSRFERLTAARIKLIPFTLIDSIYFTFVFTGDLLETTQVGKPEYIACLAHVQIFFGVSELSDSHSILIVENNSYSQ